MSVTYLTTPIEEVRIDPPPRGSGMTRDGYTKRSGAPTSRMIRLQGEKRWRRLMIWQFSNLGTLFVNIDGKSHVVREEMLPKEDAVSSAHSTMKRARGSKKLWHIFETGRATGDRWVAGPYTTKTRADEIALRWMTDPPGRDSMRRSGIYVVKGHGP